MLSICIKVCAFVWLEGFAITDSLVEHPRDAAVDIGVLLFRDDLLLIVGFECRADHFLDVCFQGQRWTGTGGGGVWGVGVGVDMGGVQALRDAGARSSGIASGMLVRWWTD